MPGSVSSRRSCLQPQPQPLPRRGRRGARGGLAARRYSGLEASSSWPSSQMCSQSGPSPRVSSYASVATSLERLGIAALGVDLEQLAVDGHALRRRAQRFLQDFLGLQVAAVSQVHVGLGHRIDVAGSVELAGRVHHGRAGRRRLHWCRCAGRRWRRRTNRAAGGFPGTSCRPGSTSCAAGPDRNQSRASRARIPPMDAGTSGFSSRSSTRLVSAGGRRSGAAVRLRGRGGSAGGGRCRGRGWLQRCAGDAALVATCEAEAAASGLARDRRRTQAMAGAVTHRARRGGRCGSGSC